MGGAGTVSENGTNGHFFVCSASAAMRALERIIAEIAPTNIPVLLIGESGTGKEVVALRIHQLSGQRNQPFRKLVSATLSPESFHSQLRRIFKVGSPRAGLRTGTLFLDEISEVHADCQARLLHLLPDGDALPNDFRISARVISSTRRNMAEEILSKRFRDELYYRLNGMCLRLPPLRHHKEDLPGLVDFLLRKYASLFGRPLPVLAPQALRQLQEYSWPGNIRQLENYIKRLVALGDERLALEPPAGPALELVSRAGAGEKVSLKQAARAASREAERELILRALAQTRWNRKRAAQELQISYKALLYKLKQIGFREPEEPLSPRGGSPW